MESVRHLQQMLCNVFYHILILLPPYLGKLKRFKFAADIEQTEANKIH